MKREARNHSKMKRLCRRLNIPIYQGVGLMESIWHVTAAEAWRGDIGKLSNEAIAIAIDYRGNEDELMNALVACGWFDVSEEHRLLVHDWAEHADQAVQKRAERAKKSGFVGFCQDTYKHFPTNRPNGSLPEPVPGPVPEPVPVPGVTGASAAPPEPPDASFADDEEQNIPDDLPAAMMGNFLLQRLSIPHSHGLAMKFADCVGLIARDERLPRGAAALRLLVRGRDHPPDSGKWRFWLEDGSWKEQVAQGISTEGWE